MSTEQSPADAMMEAAKAVWGEEPSTESPAAAPEASPEAEKPVESVKKPASAEIVEKKRAQSALEKRRIETEARARELQTREATLTQRAKEQEERESLLKLMEEDPAAYFEKKKLGPAAVRAHLERLANGLKPEEVAEKRLSAHEAELQRLRDEIKQRDERDQSEKRSQQQRAAAQEAEEGFATHISENIDAYPHLVEEFSTKEAAIKAGYELLHRVVATDAQGRKITELSAYVARHGKEPSNDIICKFLDAVAKERIEARANNAWRTRGSNTPDSGSVKPSAVTRTTPSASPGKQPRTLSNSDTGQRSAATNPLRTEEEIDAESLRILQAGFR